MTKLVIVTPDAEDFRAHISRDLPELEIAIGPAGDQEAIRRLIAEADCMLAWKFPPETLADAPRLRWIQSFGAGVDHLMAMNVPSSVVITRVLDAFSGFMAEYVVGYCYAALLDVRRILEQQRRAEWKPFRQGMLRGKTAVVVGTGSIGGEVCRLLQANGVRVIGVSRSGRAVEGADESRAVAQLDEVLPEANFLVLVAPLTPETRGMIDARRFKLLPNGAWLINVARGPLTVEADLVEALRSGHLGGAVLDVFDQEPLPAGHPLWSLENVIVTPHMSGPDENAEVARQFVANYRRFAAGEPLLNVVDRERGY